MRIKSNSEILCDWFIILTYKISYIYLKAEFLRIWSKYFTTGTTFSKEAFIFFILWSLPFLIQIISLIFLWWIWNLTKFHQILFRLLCLSTFWLWTKWWPFIYNRIFIHKRCPNCCTQLPFLRLGSLLLCIWNSVEFIVKVYYSYIIRSTFGLRN